MEANANTQPPANANQQAFEEYVPPLRLKPDPLEWHRLPKAAKDKLRGLRRDKDDKWLEWRAVADDQRQAWDDKRDAEARLKILTGGRPDSPWHHPTQYAIHNKLDNDHPEVVAQLEKLETAKDNIERLRPIVEGRAQRWNDLGRLVTSVESYLSDALQGIQGTIPLFKGNAPARQKRETPSDAVERCRKRLRELNADRHRIRSAPWPSAEAKRRARAEINKVAERGQPNVAPLIETGEGSIAWAERPITDMIIGGRPIAHYGDPRGFPLLVWLHRDTIVARLEHEIDLTADDDHALTAEQRIQQLSAIDRERLAIQREEEHWVCVAIEDGATIARRPLADPRAVLGLADSMPEPPD
jgi:hypothetical protein